MAVPAHTATDTPKRGRYRADIGGFGYQQAPHWLRSGHLLRVLSQRGFPFWTADDPLPGQRDDGQHLILRQVPG